ncbi:hypothetical protein EUX98_g7983 [Antrodiella citrinella]|uniref:Ubiquitin-like protease family profile domain-containing protein n=1 Tax=Antrodiella citrinella TaxID=2447956 RepID=A0A4S4MD16_9APHY|nr:hypothetical protein EUX98_g7983 [Antrodiella citrinella]
MLPHMQLLQGPRRTNCRVENAFKGLNVTMAKVSNDLSAFELSRPKPLGIQDILARPSNSDAARSSDLSVHPVRGEDDRCRRQLLAQKLGEMAQHLAQTDEDRQKRSRDGKVDRAGHCADVLEQVPLASDPSPGMDFEMTGKRGSIAVIDEKDSAYTKVVRRRLDSPLQSEDVHMEDVVDRRQQLAARLGKQPARSFDVPMESVESAGDPRQRLASLLGKQPASSDVLEDFVDRRQQLAARLGKQPASSDDVSVEDVKPAGELIQRRAVWLETQRAARVKDAMFETAATSQLGARLSNGSAVTVQSAPIASTSNVRTLPPVTVHSVKKPVNPTITSRHIAQIPPVQRVLQSSKNMKHASLATPRRVIQPSITVKHPPVAKGVSAATRVKTVTPVVSPVVSSPSDQAGAPDTVDPPSKPLTRSATLKAAPGTTAETPVPKPKYEMSKADQRKADIPAMGTLKAVPEGRNQTGVELKIPASPKPVEAPPTVPYRQNSAIMVPLGIPQSLRFRTIAGIYDYGDGRTEQVQYGELDRLEGKGFGEERFLNDTCARIGINMMWTKYKDPVPKERVSVFNSLQSSSLRINAEALMVYYRKPKKTVGVDLWGKEVVLLPINAESHWYLVVVLHPDRLLSPPDVSGNRNPFDTKCCILTLDSLGFMRDDVSRSTEKYLILRAAKDGKKIQSTAFHLEIRVPLQPNWTDCGVYMVWFAGKVINNLNWLKAVARDQQLRPAARAVHEKRWGETTEIQSLRQWLLDELLKALDA